METVELRAQLEKYHCESFGWALSCCTHNRAEAEDVLQAVYLKALEGKARFDGRAAFKTWLFAVIRKTAIDERRRRMARGLLLLQHESRVLPVTSVESADEAVYRSEIRNLFRQALVALPKRQREALQLVFYHDLTLAEAAEVMGVSLGSARTHYERGKNQLRQRMEVADVFDEQATGGRKHPGTVSTTETRG